MYKLKTLRSLGCDFPKRIRFGKTVLFLIGLCSLRCAAPQRLTQFDNLLVVERFVASLLLDAH